MNDLGSDLFLGFVSRSGAVSRVGGPGPTSVGHSICLRYRIFSADRPLGSGYLSGLGASVERVPVSS